MKGIDEFYYKIYSATMVHLWSTILGVIIKISYLVVWPTVKFECVPAISEPSMAVVARVLL